MIHQSDQFPKTGPSPQIYGSFQPGVVMILSTYLNKLDASAEMIYDRQVALRLPPFDIDIILPTGSHDPKRSILAGDLMDLRVPGLFLSGKMKVTLESCCLNCNLRPIVDE